MTETPTFKANGSEYPLKYTFNAFCALEEMLDTSMSEMIGSLGTGEVRMHTVRALLWAGLHEDNPDLTLDDVGKLIPLNGMQAALGQIVAAFATSGLTEEAPPATSRARGRKR